MTGALLLAAFLAQSAATPAAQSGVITGIVRAADGSPYAGQRIAALSAGDNPAGASVVSISKTDSAGRYSLEGVPPGRYYITTGPLGSPAYYPGTWKRMSASVVNVHSGERIEGLDFRLPDLSALLESKDPVDQAWGGWLAAEAARVDLAPLLVKALDSRLRADAHGDAEQVAIDTILDALIRLDAKVPLTTASTLYEWRPAQALILLARLGPDADTVLAEIADSQDRYSWFASTNLLIEHHAPGVAASILEGLHLEIYLRYCAGPCQIIPMSASGGGDMLSGIITASLARLPSLPKYTLSLSDGKPLAPGPVPVFVQRRVETSLVAARPDLTNTKIVRPTGDDRLAYLKSLAPEAQVALRAREVRLINSVLDEKALNVQAEEFQREVRERYSTLLKALLASGALTPEEAAKYAEPSLEFTIDRR